MPVFQLSSVRCGTARGGELSVGATFSPSCPTRRVAASWLRFFFVVAGVTGGCSCAPNVVSSDVALVDELVVDGSPPSDDAFQLHRYGVRGPPDNPDPHVAAREARGEASLPVELTVPSRADAPYADAPRVRMLGTEIIGRLPAEAIGGVVRRRIGAMRACLEKRVGGDPVPVHGVVVSFTIERDGSVVGAKASSELPRDMTDCIAKVFDGLTFPAPEGGLVRVTYPIRLSIPNEES